MRYFSHFVSTSDIDNIIIYYYFFLFLYVLLLLNVKKKLTISYIKKLYSININSNEKLVMSLLP